DAADIFTDAVQREIWDVLVMLAEDETAYLDTAAVIENVPEPIAEMIPTLLTYTEAQEQWYPTRIVAEAEAILRRLLDEYATERNREMQELVAEAMTAGDREMAEQYQAESTR